MIDKFIACFQANKNTIEKLFRRFKDLDMQFMLPNILLDEFDRFDKEEVHPAINLSPLRLFFEKTQEAVIDEDLLYFNVRPRVAAWNYFRYEFTANTINEVDILDFLKFKQSSITVDAVIRNFEIIGEAAKNVPDFIKDKYKEIPWKKMYGLRNLISHEYFGVDYEMIWEIISTDLPHNLLDIKEILKED